MIIKPLVFSLSERSQIAHNLRLSEVQVVHHHHHCCYPFHDYNDDDHDYGFRWKFGSRTVAPSGSGWRQGWRLVEGHHLYHHYLPQHNINIVIIVIINIVIIIMPALTKINRSSGLDRAQRLLFRFQFMSTGLSSDHHRNSKRNKGRPLALKAQFF